jgi:hypothetical protein
MLRAFILILSPLLSAGLVLMFGWAALAMCFGLAFLTLVCSTQGLRAKEVALELGTPPAALGR